MPKRKAQPLPTPSSDKLRLYFLWSVGEMRARERAPNPALAAALSEAKAPRLKAPDLKVAQGRLLEQGLLTLELRRWTWAECCGAMFHASPAFRLKSDYGRFFDAMAALWMAGIEGKAPRIVGPNLALPAWTGRGLPYLPHGLPGRAWGLAMIQGFEPLPGKPAKPYTPYAQAWMLHSVGKLLSAVSAGILPGWTDPERLLTDKAFREAARERQAAESKAADATADAAYERILAAHRARQARLTPEERAAEDDNRAAVIDAAAEGRLIVTPAQWAALPELQRQFLSRLGVTPREFPAAEPSK